MQTKQLTGQQFKLTPTEHEHYNKLYPNHVARQQFTTLLREALRTYILTRIRLADDISDESMQELDEAREQVAVLYELALIDGLNSTGTEARLARQCARERVRYG